MPYEPPDDGGQQKPRQHANVCSIFDRRPGTEQGMQQPANLLRSQAGCPVVLTIRKIEDAEEFERRADLPRRQAGAQDDADRAIED